MCEANFTCTDHIVPGQHIRHYARGTSQSQEDDLFLSVKQYTPRCNTSPRPGDVTILACHASGYPKELYEPIWDQMLQRMVEGTSLFRIRNIWMADVANQNASGVLNEEKLGSELNHFRKEMPRPLVGFGHSMGGTVMINLALLHPRLLTTLFLVEPVVNRTPGEMNFRGAYGLTFKKDTFSDRQEASKYLSKHPICKIWDPSVFALYLKHGYRETPTFLYNETSKITQTTTKHQEVFSYIRSAHPQAGKSLSSFQADPNHHFDLDIQNQPADSAFYLPAATQTFSQLPLLAPSCFYLTGSKTHMWAGGKQGRQEKLDFTGIGVGGSGGYAKGRVAEQLIEGSHFAPFEKPVEVANVTVDWLQSELERWQWEEIKESQSQQHLTARQKLMMDDDSRWWVHKMFGPKDANVKANKARL